MAVVKPRKLGKILNVYLKGEVKRLEEQFQDFVIKKNDEIIRLKRELNSSYNYLSKIQKKEEVMKRMIIERNLEIDKLRLLLSDNLSEEEHKLREDIEESLKQID